MWDIFGKKRREAEEQQRKHEEMMRNHEEFQELYEQDRPMTFAEEIAQVKKSQEDAKRDDEEEDLRDPE